MRSLFLLLSVVVVSVASPAFAAKVDLQPVEKPASTFAMPPLRCGACVATLVSGAVLYGAAWVGSTVLMATAASRLLAQPLDHSELGFIHDLFVPIEAGSTLVIALPVIGPMVGSLYFRDDPTLQALAWVDAGVQAAGLVTMVVSAVMHGSHEKRAHEEATRVHVVPLVRPGASGMAIGGAF